MRYPIAAVLTVTALLLPSCGGRKGKPSAYVSTTEVPNAVFFKDLGLEVQHFEVKALKNFKVTIWMETYVDGKLREDLSCGSSQTPTEGKAIEKDFRFSRLHDLSKGHGEGKSNQVRWQFGFDHTATGRDWMDDPLEDHASTSTDAAWNVELISGQTVTVWTLGASGKGIAYSGNEAQIKRNPFALFLRCRMEPLGPEDRWSVFTNFDGVPGQ